MLEIYLDGACRDNQNSDKSKTVGAWAFAVWDNGNRIHDDGEAKRETTNNCMELTAFYEALQYVLNNEYKEVTFNMDSKYVLDAVTQGWALKWRSEKFMKNGTFRPNHELWEQVLTCLDGADFEDVQLHYNYIKGHSGNANNEYVDKLCNKLMDNLDQKENKVNLKTISFNDIVEDLKSVQEEEVDRDEDEGVVDAGTFITKDIVSPEDLTSDQKRAIQAATKWYKGRKSTVFTIGSAAGSGKSQPVDTLVPTPSGYRRFGDLQVGDYLFDRKGQPTKITAIYPQGILDNYELTFANHRVAHCSLNHLWSYYTNRGNLCTKPLSDIIKDYEKTDKRGHKAHKYSMPVNMAVQYPQKQLPVDPYVLGCFIGDGNLKNSGLEITSEDNEIPLKIADILNVNVTQGNTDTYKYHWSFRPKNAINPHQRISSKSIFGNIPEIFNKYSYEKSIPEIYMLGSIEQRYALLQGLMDTDGSIDTSNRYHVNFATTSKKLAEQMIELLRSLGYDGTIRTDNREEKYTTGIAYNIFINIANEEKIKLFRLSRKVAIAKQCQNIRKKHHYDRTALVDVKLVGQAEMMCVDVDNPEHLYLTESLCCTHNCIHEDSDLFYEHSLRKIKDAQTGDRIYGADGRLCTITNVFKQPDLKRCYKIRFNDGTSILADDDQLFNISYDNKTFVTKTLADFRESTEKIYFPINKCLNIDQEPPLVPPELIGLLMNPKCDNIIVYNEGKVSVCFSERRSTIMPYVNRIKQFFRQHGFSSQNGNNDVIFTINRTAAGTRFFNEFKAYNLISTKMKTLPIRYVFMYKNERIKLLQAFLGVKDITEGNDYQCIMANVSIRALRLLVESLGGLFIEGNSVHCTISLPEDITPVKSKYFEKYISSITPYRTMSQTYCITVDNKDKLYVSNDCIVVHNTSIIPHVIDNIGLNRGHALPITAKVLKRTGFVPIGTLKVGDEICGGNGQFVKVKGIYPQGEREMYRITFSDKTSVLCDLEHLWTVSKGNEKYTTMSLRSLVESGICKDGKNKRYRIPIVQPIQFAKQKLPIEPYLLGTLLHGITDESDGLLFKTRHPEIAAKVQRYLYRYNLKFDTDVKGKKRLTYHIISKPGVNSVIEFSNILDELHIKKCPPEEIHIPVRYLFGSHEQRLELLNGIIDCMGYYPDKRTNNLKPGNKHSFMVTVSSPSKFLIQDIKFLVQSLGGIAATTEYKGTTGSKYNYFDRIYAINLVIMPYNMDIANNEIHTYCDFNKLKLARFINQIDKVDQKMEAICIEVDEPNGLFVTDNFIVTHNTTTDKIAYATYTGRAAMVLRKKGIPATTIHKLIYDPVIKYDRNGIVLSIDFKKKKHLSPGLKLIVIDEFSMVDENMMKDLESFKIPIIMFGDPFQLPPINGVMNKYANNYDITLTETHRQAKDNPILWLANKIRSGDPRLQYGSYGENLIILPKEQLSKDVMFSVSQVICGLRQSRDDINKSFRKHLGFKDDNLHDNDKIVCTKNNWLLEPLDGWLYLMNGMVGYAKFVSVNKNGKPILDFMMPDLGKSFIGIEYSPKSLTGQDMSFTGYHDRGNRFMYGYAITAHAAQGGEFQSVCLWEDVVRADQHIHWLYTAVTRAKEKLIIYH